MADHVLGNQEKTLPNQTKIFANTAKLDRSSRRRRRLMRKTGLWASVLGAVLFVGTLTPRATAQTGYNNNGNPGLTYSYHQPDGPYNSPFGSYYQYQPNWGQSYMPSNSVAGYQPNVYQVNHYQPALST
jgi:hypothetical protein